MNEVIYTQNDLIDLSDDELLAILAKSWGIEDGKFEVWGELPALGDTSFGFIRNPYLVKTGEQVYYPVQGYEQEPCEIFIAPQDASKCGSKKHNRFVRCELELSPVAERKKYNNPLSLCVKKGTGEALQFLPKEIPQDVLVNPSSDNERSQLISKSIYDFYYEKAKAEFSELIEQKRSQQEEYLAVEEAEIRGQLEQKRRQQEEYLSAEETGIRRQLELQNQALEKAVADRNLAIEVGKKLYDNHAKLTKTIEQLKSKKQY